MDYIQCDVMTDDESHVGHIKVLAVPRIGECLWFSQKRKGHTSYRVIDIAHWIGNGEGQAYHKVAVFVEPTLSDKEV